MSPAADLQQIVAGPGGALWFTEKGADDVGRITTAGQITEYPIPNNASGLADTGPTGIVSSGGGLWFLTDIGESTYRMGTNGTFSLVCSNQLYRAGRVAATAPVATRSCFAQALIRRRTERRREASKVQFQGIDRSNSQPGEGQ